MKKNFAFGSFIVVFGLLFFNTAGFSQTAFGANNHDDYRDFFSRYFDRADREITPHEWMEQARAGLDEARVLWYEILPEINRDQTVPADTEAEFQHFSEQELENRFTQWLYKRFMVYGLETMTDEIQKTRFSADKLFLYKTDGGGNILFDNNTGNPLLIRPDAGSFENDFEYWKNLISDSAQSEIQNYKTIFTSFHPELLMYVAEENRAAFGQKLDKITDAAIESIQHEYAAVIAREERHFVARRLGDIYSLRRRSESESAFSIGSQLIEETQKITEEGLAVLEAKIERTDSGTGDMVLEGSDWLAMFREQFERGLRAWEDAEERFLVRRLEWEQEAVNGFRESEDAWNNAFDQFDEARYEWETKTKNLFESGEARFLTASAILEDEIREARAEFIRNSSLRIRSGAEQAKAWADVYITAASMVDTAKTNIDFWLNRYQNETSNAGSGIFLSDRQDDFDNWVAGEMLFWKDRNNKTVNTILDELEKWSGLRSYYNTKAIESIDFLKNEFNLVLNSESFGGIPDSLSSDDVVFPDEYQGELLRIRAVAAYWEKRVLIAEAVADYAEDITAGRITESEGEEAWEIAKLQYDAALTLYERSMEQIKMAGADMTTIQENMARAIDEITNSEATLEVLNNKLNNLLAAYRIRRENDVTTRIDSKKSELSSVKNILDNLEDDSITVRYLKAACEYGVVADNQFMTEMLEEIVAGKSYFDESLWELSEKALEADASFEEALLSGSEESYVLAAFKTTARRKELNRLMMVQLLNADSFEIWYREFDGDLTGLDFSDPQMTTTRIEQHLTEEWKKANHALFKARTVLELEALGILAGDEGTSNDAVFLSAYGLVDEDEVENAVNALKQVLALLEENEGAKQSEWITAIENAALDDEYIHYYLTEESFFEHNENSFRSDLFLVDQIDMFEKADGILTAYYLLKTVSPAIKIYAESELLNNLHETYGTYNIGSYGLVPDDSGVFINALLDNDGDSLVEAAKFLHGLDNMLLNLPEWLIEESNEFKNNFVLEFALRYGKRDVPRSTAEISSEMNNREEEYDVLMAEEYHDWIEKQKIAGEKQKEIDFLKHLFIVTEKIEEITINTLSENENSETLRRSTAVLNYAYDIYKINAYRMTENLDYLIHFYLSDPSAQWNDELVSNEIVQYEETNDFHKNELTRNRRHEQFLISELEALEDILASDDSSKSDLQEEIKALENEIEAVRTVLNSQEAAYLNLANISAGGSFDYESAYNESRHLFLSAEARRFEYEKQEAIKRWAATAYSSVNNALEDLNYSRDRQNRALAALAALETFNGEADFEGRFINPEYAKLYNEYKESQSFLFASINSLEALNGSLEKAREDYRLSNEAYQNQMASLGGFMFEDNWYLDTTDERRGDLWDRMTIRNGKLVLASSKDFGKIEKTEAEQQALQNYFTKSIDFGNELISPFQVQLMEFNRRLGLYKFDEQLFRKWGEMGYYFFRDSDYKNDSIFEKIGKFFSSMLSEVLGLIFGKDFLSSISAEERDDFEFFTLLVTADGSYGNFDFFENAALFLEAEDRYQRAVKELKSAKGRAGWVIIGGLFENDVKEAQYELDRTSARYTYALVSMQETITTMNRGINFLNEKHDKFIETANALGILSGSGKPVSWDNLRQALVCFDIPNDDLRLLENQWFKNSMDTGYSFRDIPQALEQLVAIGRRDVTNNRLALDKVWADDNNEFLEAENAYQAAFRSYLDGEISLDDFSRAAERAYGENRTSIKTHIIMQSAVLENTMGGFFTDNFAVTGDYRNLVYDYVNLLVNTYQAQYDSQLSVLEDEWNLQRVDIEEKYRLWVNGVEEIVEAGTEDWNNNREKLEESYRAWCREFENDYNQTKDAWTAAYLAGLEEKQIWMESATGAANEASSEAILTMVGSDAESMARAMDTRDPVYTRAYAGKESVDKAFDNLVFRVGLNKLDDLFGSLNGITGSLNLTARSGIGSFTGSNYGIIQSEAARFVKAANENLASRELVRAAVNLQDMAKESIQMIGENVRQSNDSTRAEMDKIFMVQGHFKHSGMNYVRDVLVHSTFFNSVITESVLIEGYKDFVMTPIHLGTDLSEENIRQLDSLAIELLMENLLAELSGITTNIFGVPDSGDDVSPKGEFGLHLGKLPVLKESLDIDDGKAGIFTDMGSGELGRLMTEFQYWYIKEEKGLALLNTAPWDRPLWDSRGSFFEAPSLRSATSIGLNVIATVATGGIGSAAGFALNMASDFVFGVADVAGGYKSWSEAGVEFGKSLLSNTVNLGVGSLNGAMGSQIAAIAAKGSGHQIAAAIGQGIFEGMTGLASGTINSAISSVTYTDEDQWGFSYDTFNSGLQSSLKGALASATTTVTSGVLNAGLEGFGNSLYTSGQKLNNLVGGLAGEGLNYLLGDDFTLNVLNVGLFDERNRLGLLELHLGRGDSTMNFGSGGVDAGFDSLASAIEGMETWKVNAEVLLSSGDGAGKYASQLRTLYSGAEIQRQEYYNVLSGKTVYSERRDVEYTESVYNESTGEKIVYLGNDALDDSSRLGLNVLFAHEAYRDGIVDDAYSQALETERAVEGHNNTALDLMNTYGNDSVGEQAGSEALAFTHARETGNMEIAQFILDNYDSSADYWKLVKNRDDYWDWIDDGSRDFDINDWILTYDIMKRDDTAKHDVSLALRDSGGEDGKEFGIISKDRMTFSLASSLGNTVIAQPKQNGFYTGELYGYAELDDSSRLTRNLFIKRTMDKVAANVSSHESGEYLFNPEILGDKTDGFDYLVPVKLLSGTVVNVIMNGERFQAYYNQRMVEEASKLVGGNYVWGGKDPVANGGLDCSGAAQWAMMQVYGAGIRERNAHGQAVDPKLTIPGDNSPGTLNFYNWNKEKYGTTTGDDIYDHVTTNLENGHEINPFGNKSNTVESPGKIIILKIPGLESYQSTINRQINWHYIFFE